jgi:hypothetical protein
MLTDKLTTFGNALALNTGAANTYLIGSQIDLGAAHRDIGLIRPLFFELRCHTDVDSAGDGVTLQFKLASDASASVSTTTSTVHMTSPVFTQAQCVAGALLWSFALPWEGNVYEQFLGLLQVTAVEAVTAGKITATIAGVPGRPKLFYPEAAS